MRADATGVRPALPDVGAIVGTSSGSTVSVTPGYSDAAGSWTEVIASISGEAHWLLVALAVFNVSASSQTGFGSIGVGAAASEVAVVDNWAVGGALSSYSWLPVRIASGSRIAFRYSTPHATLPASVSLRVTAFGRPATDTRRSPTSLTALGVTGTNLGTAVTANNTWTQITASTTQPYQGLIWAARTADTVIAGTPSRHALGVGGSGAEVQVLEELVGTSSSESFSTATLPRLVHIPAGSRIAAKSDDGSAAQFQFAPLAVPYT